MTLPPDEVEACRRALVASVEAGLSALAAGTVALEAVVHAVMVMENFPLFNVGREPR